MTNVNLNSSCSSYFSSLNDITCVYNIPVSCMRVWIQLILSNLQFQDFIFLGNSGAQLFSIKKKKSIKNLTFYFVDLADSREKKRKIKTTPSLLYGIHYTVTKSIFVTHSSLFRFHISLDCSCSTLMLQCFSVKHQF